MQGLNLAIAVGAVLVALCGCAHRDTAGDPAQGGPHSDSGGAVVTEQAPGGGGEATALAWSSAAFRFVTPPGRSPDWRLDHLVAGEVVAPVIAGHDAYLKHWRVHRRAAPDEAGHQFTLFVYTSPARAQAVFDDVTASPVLDQLNRAGHLRQLVLLEGGPDGRPRVEDTSDSHWSPALARAWPRFIEGVSDAWVALVVEHTPPPAAEESIEEMLARYGVAADAVTAVWRDEGTHAFLHHISAVFGYAPLLMRF